MKTPAPTINVVSDALSVLAHIIEKIGAKNAVIATYWLRQDGDNLHIISQTVNDVQGFLFVWDGEKWEYVEPS